MLFLLIYNDSNIALYKIQTFDSSCSKSSYENVTLCPNNCNVITKDQSQEKLLFDIVERIEETKIKHQCLHELKSFLPKNKVIKSRIQPFSVRQLLKIFEGKGLNQLKAKVKELNIHIEKQNLLEE